MKPDVLASEQGVNYNRTHQQWGKEKKTKQKKTKEKRTIGL